MPDPSSSTSSDSSSSSSAPGQTPSTFNQAQLEDLETAEHIVQSARTEPFKTGLLAREITTTITDHLASLCFTARQRTAKVVREETAGETLTQRAARDEHDLLIGEINDRRIEIQFAADGAYPYTDTLNEEARRAFQLSLTRPFSG